MSDLRQAEISGFYVGIRYTGSLKWIESRSSVKLIETFDWNCRTCVAWVHNQTEMWRWSHTTAAEVLFVKHVVSMDTDVVTVRLWQCSLTPAVIQVSVSRCVSVKWLFEAVVCLLGGLMQQGDAHTRITECMSVVSGVFTAVSAGVLAAARSALTFCSASFWQPLRCRKGKHQS